MGDHTDQKRRWWKAEQNPFACFILHSLGLSWISGFWDNSETNLKLHSWGTSSPSTVPGAPKVLGTCEGSPRILACDNCLRLAKYRIYCEEKTVLQMQKKYFLQNGWFILPKWMAFPKFFKVVFQAQEGVQPGDLGPETWKTSSHDSWQDLRGWWCESSFGPCWILT